MCDEFVGGKRSCAITCRKAGGEVEEEGATAGVDSTRGLRRVCARGVLEEEREDLADARLYLTSRTGNLASLCV